MIDPSTLLCERCGYVIEGLPREGACPECGWPIVASLPERRTGTPWQREPTLRLLTRTCLAMWRNPAAVFDQVRLGDDARARGAHWRLESAMNVAAMVVAAAPVGLVAVLAAVLSGGRDLAGVVLIALSAAIMATVVVVVIGLVILTILNGIEHAGVRFIGRRRGWRVSVQVADAACALASAGWVGGACLSTALFTIGFLVLLVSMGDRGSWVGSWLMVAAPVVGAVCGLIWFEILVFVGVRRLRFANHSRPSAVADVPSADPAPAPPAQT